MTVASFKHATHGIIHAVTKHRNIRIHLVMAVFALTTAWILHLNHTEFLILLFTINLVITSEMINTAIESMTDLITKDYRLEAKIAKDVSAGMVLTSSFLAVIVGITLFTPHLLALINH